MMFIDHTASSGPFLSLLQACTGLVRTPSLFANGIGVMARTDHSKGADEGVLMVRDTPV